MHQITPIRVGYYRVSVRLLAEFSLRSILLRETLHLKACKCSSTSQVECSGICGSGKVSNCSTTVNDALPCKCQTARKAKSHGFLRTNSCGNIPELELPNPLSEAGILILLWAQGKWSFTVHYAK